MIGYFYALVYPVLDFSPLAWHVATLVLRLFGNLAFWWLLRLVWPTRRMETLAIALLFAVYPGYSVQPNAGVYSTDLIAHAAALVSIALAIVAMRSARRVNWLVILSALAGALELFYLGMFESAIGLEVARMTIIWYLIWQRDGSGFRLRFLAGAQGKSALCSPCNGLLDLAHLHLSKHSTCHKSRCVVRQVWRYAGPLLNAGWDRDNQGHHRDDGPGLERTLLSIRRCRPTIGTWRRH